MARSDSIAEAVEESIKNGTFRSTDAGGIALVRGYARLLDEARDTHDEWRVYKDIGPKLLNALTALRLTPRAAQGRPAQGEEPKHVPTKLDELRSRRVVKAV